MAYEAIFKESFRTKRGTLNIVLQALATLAAGAHETGVGTVSVTHLRRNAAHLA